MADARRYLRFHFKIVLMLSALALVCGITGLLLSQSMLLLILGAAIVSLAWLVPVLYAVRFRDRAALVNLASKSDVKNAVRTVSEKVDDSRAKESRHEYHQERSLERIEDELRRLHVAAGASGLPTLEPAIDVLFVTSNGAGLGHVSRLLAISEQLPEGRRFEILTLSKAYKQAASSGVTVHYFPSREAIDESPARWNRVFRDYFRRLIFESRPRVIVFDGTWVYQGLTDVCRALGIPLIWVQRGMWKPEVDVASVQRHAANTVADVVIVPGDYAGFETVDVGPAIEPHYVGPIVRTTRSDLLAREEACRVLGLDPNKRYMLLNLAGGMLGDPTSIVSSAVDRIADIAPDLQVVQVVSPLAVAQQVDSRISQLQAYPVMPYARAFEFTVSAAGYNAAQEAVSLGVPAILVPNASTMTDDQVRRARLLAERGSVMLAEDRPGLEKALYAMADTKQRDILRRALNDHDEAKGASEAARIIDEVIERASWPLLADTING